MTMLLLLILRFRDFLLILVMSVASICILWSMAAPYIVPAALALVAGVLAYGYVTPAATAALAAYPVRIALQRVSRAMVIGATALMAFVLVTDQTAAYNASGHWNATAGFGIAAIAGALSLVL